MGTLFVPGVGNVPVVWKPSPDHYNGRNGQPIRAIVHHRAVSSSLSSMDSTLISSTRQVSSTFGIGHVNGKPEIHQYVDLSDGPWTNGDCQQGSYPSLPSRWDGWYGHHDHNVRTVTIEHEDNGGDRTGVVKGIVDEDIILTSMALDKLLLSGDLAAIRAAGIHCRDAASATQLGAIVPGPKTLIDHNDIAGKLKPYCWRPWIQDGTGFPRDRYVAYMTALPDTSTTEDPMPVLVAPDILGFTATVKSNMNVRKAPSLKAAVIRVTSSTESWKAIGWVKGDVDPADGSDLWLCRFNNGQFEYTTHANLASQPVDPTPYSKAQVDAAVSAAVAPLNARITSIKGKVAASAADIADD